MGFNKKLNLEEYEANVVFQIAMFIASDIKQIEKKYDKNEISIIAYLDFKKKYIFEIENFRNKIMEINNA